VTSVRWGVEQLTVSTDARNCELTLLKQLPACRWLYSTWLPTAIAITATMATRIAAVATLAIPRTCPATARPQPDTARSEESMDRLALSPVTMAATPPITGKNTNERIPRTNDSVDNGSAVSRAPREVIVAKYGLNAPAKGDEQCGGGGYRGPRAQGRNDTKAKRCDMAASDSARDRILSYLADHGGAVADPAGRGLTDAMAETLGERPAALSAILGQMESDGVIEREMRGLRTYRISLVASAPAPAWQAAATSAFPTPSQFPAPPQYQPASAQQPPPRYQPPPQFPPPQANLRYGPPPSSPRTNSLAIASMVLSIVTIFGIGSVIGIVFGIIAHLQISRSHGAQVGRGLATAGIVVGVLTLLLLIAIIRWVSFNGDSFGHDLWSG